MDDSLLIQPILSLIAELPPEYQERLVLIGGQAIAFWGAYFLEGQLDQEHTAALTSSDLDIAAGTVEGVRVLADQWKGVPIFPTPDDHVPNMALIKLYRPEILADGHFVVDVMNQVYGGIDADSMRVAARLVEWDLHQDGQHILRFYVLNPAALLWTRIANLKHRRMRQKAINRELVRTKVLCRIVREDISYQTREMFLDPDARRPTLDYAKYVYRDISKHKDTRSVLAQYPTLIQAFLFTIPDSPHWPENFMRGVGVWQGRLLRHVNAIIDHKIRRDKIREQKKKAGLERLQ